MGTTIIERHYMQTNPIEMEQIWSKSGKEESLKSLFVRL